MTPTASQAPINLAQGSYRRLRVILAERIRPVALWCGAGLSKPANLPDWTELKSILVKDLEEKAYALLESDPERTRLMNRAASIDKETNTWVAFTMLRNELGKSSFKAGIREQFAKSDRVPVPDQYLGFWKIGIRGIVNLNLDRLATRAYAESHMTVLQELNSNSIYSGPVVLGSGKQFVINLHGIIEDENTWVFTNDELKSLQRKKAYKTTLSALFTNFTVLFAGISADDVAAGGFLQSLTDAGIDLGEHFWMTSLETRSTDKWAENAGLQLIRYHSANGHEQAFKMMFSDLAAFVSEEDNNVPAIRSKVAIMRKKITDPIELASLSPEEIRNHLAARARNILEASNEPVPNEYRTFVEQYSRAIYISWYVNKKPPDNIFFGYKIVEALGGGAFSNVYRATDPDGAECAIKIMHERLSNNENMQICFRRGIKSMRILHNRDVTGMVRLIDAVDLPAAIFMEYVNGPTLESVVDAQVLEPWDDGLRILLRAAAIVRKGHRLPERVLHRDIRPSNIMLRNFYDPTKETEVVVLDFDLSWHRGAYDVTVDEHAQAALGYLAPEQVHRDVNVSTRSSAVDSYGLCATIYFVFAGEHPGQGLFRDQDFQRYFRQKCASAAKLSALSAGNRLRRLVTSGVARRQADRPDFGEIENALLVLDEAIHDIGEVVSPDFWAEELLCRARGENSYTYDAEKQLYETILISGLKIQCVPDYANNSVRVNLSYAAGGEADRRNVAKYLEQRMPEVIATMKSAGFKIQKGSDKVWATSFSVNSEIKTKMLREAVGDAAQALKNVIDRLSVN